jgi:hypothetical protein
MSVDARRAVTVCPYVSVGRGRSRHVLVGHCVLQSAGANSGVPVHNEQTSQGCTRAYKTNETTKVCTIADIIYKPCRLHGLPVDLCLRRARAFHRRVQPCLRPRPGKIARHVIRRSVNPRWWPLGGEHNRLYPDSPSYLES